MKWHESWGSILNTIIAKGCPVEGMSKDTIVGFVGEFVMEETRGGFGKLAGVEFWKSGFKGLNHLFC